jgi:regulation of enolase protein 1 (concanavalin A-like superfamily)
MTTDQKTDFWQKTHYGFERDSGHFLGVSVSEEFTARVRVQGEFRSLYDQAGLMLRIDETRWIKTGVEFTDGERFLSTVVTNGSSDWSVSQPFQGLETSSYGSRSKTERQGYRPRRTARYGRFSAWRRSLPRIAISLDRPPVRRSAAG